VTLFIDVLHDADEQPVFSVEEAESVAAIYGPVHSRLLKRALDLITVQRLLKQSKKARHAVSDGAGAPMGRTLGELQRTLSAGELLMWAEYDRENPIGDVRADIRNAQIVSAIYGSQGLKLDLMRLYCSGPMEAKTLMTVILLQGLKRHLCLQVNDFFHRKNIIHCIQITKDRSWNYLLVQ
jgi:hypothetical protein